MAGTDFSHLTDDELINGIKALNIPDYIRTKSNGIDVRETLAQMTEMTIQLGVNMGLSPDDALNWARKLQESVSQSEFDSWVATLLDGGPSIFMNTLSELKTTYPNGAAGVALVRETDPAKIYVWNGTAWEDFGAYQGIEVKDGSITKDKIADKTVTPDKLSFTLLKQIYSPNFWELGYIDLTGRTGADAKRARSNFIPLKKGSLIKSGNSSVELLIVCYDGTKTRIANGAAWLKEYEVPYDRCEWVRIGLRYSDNRDVSNLADLYSSIQIYSNPETKMELQRTPAKWELGTIDISGVEYDSSNRLRTNLIKSIDNQFIRLLDESYQYYAVLYDENLNFDSVSGGWGTQPKHYLVTHPYFKVVIRKVDSSDFSENEIKQIHNKIEINNDRLVGEDIALGQIEKEHLSFDFETETSPLKGKKLLNFGDSIAAASTTGVDGYHEQISNRNGMQLKSYASGGATITVRTGVSDAHDIVTQVNNSVNNKDIADYILINGGTNDANALTSDKFGDVSDGYDAVLDTGTFCGAFEYMLKSLKTNFTIPNGTKIIYVRSHNMASRDKRQVTLGELAVEICKKWSVPVVDLYSECGLNTNLPGMVGAYTIANDDRTHPNTLGYELFYTPLIESKMKSI